MERSGPQVMRPASYAGGATIGTHVRGLNAAVVGTDATANARARFDVVDLVNVNRRGATVTPPASGILTDPITIVSTAGQGTVFSLTRRGRWKIDAWISTLGGAGAVAAALLVDPAAALITAAGLPAQADGITVLDRKRILHTTATDDNGLFLTGQVDVVQGDRPNVSLVLGDNAGGAIAVARIDVAGSWINFTRMGDVT